MNLYYLQAPFGPWPKRCFIGISFSALVTFGAYSLLFAQGPRGGPDAPDIKLVEKFDTDASGLLDTTERSAAREFLASNSRGRGPGGFFGGGPGRGRNGPLRGNGRQAGAEGREVHPDDVQVYGDDDLYAPGVLRTLFLDFDNPEWESELEDFKPTDVEVPCSLTVDGRVYPNIGVSFRGASSFFMIPAGNKRSLNLSIDYADENQRLYGYKTLNLLNCNGDASLMSSYLYSHIAGQKIAVPKVNFVKVVINGRNWGIYANAQQFNKDFLKENYGSKKGNRWKVNGNPHADAGLRYMGEQVDDYRAKYELKSKESEQAWADLISLCRLIEETPAEDLDRVLEDHLDLDGTLWFLAVDVCLVNSDGYWTRASDYSIYQNKDGKFHILPHDMNEAFASSHGGGGPGRGRPPGGFDPLFFFFGPEGSNPRAERGPGEQRSEDDDRIGGGPGSGRRGVGPRERGGPSRGGPGRGFGPPGGGGHGGVTLDPLVGLDNEITPLRSKLLANEQLRNRYLEYVKLIATDFLNWNQLGPQVASARALIQSEVKEDTRKLMTFEAFLDATDGTNGKLREFCEQRASFLLEHQAITGL